MLNTLSPNPGAKKKRKRVGRGPGCHGKTSGRGHKGQNSRSGGKVSPWFEGGQTELKRRTPKRGFTNINKVVYDLINLSDLNRFKKGEVVSIDELITEGLASGKNLIKILGNGELEVELTVKAHAFTKSAAKQIADKGGTIEIL